MAEINLEIAGEPGRVSAHALQIGVQQTVGLLDEYTYAMAERRPRAHFRWNVRNMASNGSLRVNFSSILEVSGKRAPLSDNSASVTSSLVGGIRMIDDALTPPYISSFGMKRVESLVKSIERNEATSFTLKSSDLSASITKHTGESLIKLIEVKRKAIGSVEGRLVGINVAKSLKLSIVHHVTRQAVSCIIGEEYMDFAKHALGKRVIVHGTLHKNLNGDTISIDVTEGDMVLFDSGQTVSQLAALSAMPIPDFAKTTHTDDYLTGSRGE